MWSIYNPEGGAPFYLNAQLAIGKPRVEYGAWTDWPSASFWLVPPPAPETGHWRWLVTP